MLMSSDDPYIVAWKEYERSHDQLQLLNCIPTMQDQSAAPNLILWLAVGRGEWNLVAVLRDRGVTLPKENEGGFVAIFDVITEFGDVPDSIRWLVDHGADVNARSVNDWTPLHLACRNGYLGSVRALVDNGADIDAQTSVDGGWTPLMEAAACGRRAIVAFLLERGANAKLVNELENASAKAIAEKHGHLDIADLLSGKEKA